MLDEIASGVPSAGAPDLERGFGLSHAAATAVLFLVPGLIGLVAEPFVFLLADRFAARRRWFVAGGLAGMALGAAACAAAPSVAWFAAGHCVWFCATGIATSLAQGALVDAHPDARGRTMTRWTIAQQLGDLLAPALLALVAAAGFGWRAAFALVAGLLAAHAVAVAAVRWPDEAPAASGDDDDAPPVPLLAALRDRALLAWLFGTALCDLLDEILVVFAAIRARDALGAGPTGEAILLGAAMLGGMAGLVVLERLLAAGRDERRVLVACSLACAVAYAAWLLAPSLAVAVPLLALVGATSAPLYPLAIARAYARVPGRSGVVLAASHLFTPFALLLPIGLGVLADRCGTASALLALLAQPLGLAALASARPSQPPSACGTSSSSSAGSSSR